MRPLITAVTTRSTTTVVLSGAFIAGALVVGRLTTIAGAGEVLMLAAAVVAGLPVASTALQSLRSRHVSI